MTLATYPLQRRRQSLAVATPPRPTRAATQALIVHRADVVRAGVSALLTSGSACEVSSAASVYEAFRVAAALHPTVVLFDYGAAEGPEACRLLAGLWPRPRLIALVGRGQPVTARDCLAAGADAAIAIDNVSREAFLVAVRRATDGLGPVAAGFGPDSSEGRAPGRDAAAAEDETGPLALLTPREREMLYLIGEGLSNREIADSLVLSVKTVEAHRANLSRKLNIRSRAGLMRLALTGSLS
ncbi:MAG TPA: response regulator transcription factor [Candidatus Limnocylindrales bacterium]